jgi:hypothetical protein
MSHDDDNDDNEIGTNGYMDGWGWRRQLGGGGKGGLKGDGHRVGEPNN